MDSTDTTTTKQATSEEDLIVQQCRAEYDAGLLYRHDREQTWQLIENFYFNRAKKSLKGKFNVPVPIIPGFVDTWTSKMSKHVTLSYEQQNEAEYRAVLKANALINAEKSHDDYDWDMADSDGKKLAAMSGRSIYKYYAESKPSYKSHLDPVDHYDFIADPMGGGDLEKHSFVQQDNIFRSKTELKEKGEAGIYNAAQVERLVNTTSEGRLVDNDNSFHSKQNRFTALGLDGISHNYAGQSLYKFIEAGTTYNGKRYYCLFNYETGIWVRCQPLKQVFKSEKWWFVSWATHRDTFNFWSKSPCDDMIPMAEVIRVLVNQELDNRNKRNYGQRAYDPQMFPNPVELEWKQDGLVRVKAGASTVNEISRGIYEFETPELQGTLDLVTWIDGMLKEKTGINSEAQGQTDSSKVGIAYLNVQQSAERTTLIYESYYKCWQAIGRRYLYGLSEHMRKALPVKIIGEKGAEWDEITRLEINTEWSIRVEGGDQDAQEDAMKKQALTQLFATLTPDELAVTSPKWRVKTKFRIAEVDEDDIRLAFDLQEDGNREILSRASQMIQDVLEETPIKLYRGANTAFVQKIIDYATDTDLPLDQYKKLMAAAQMHMEVAQQNMVRKAMQDAATMKMNMLQNGTPVGTPPQPGAAPGPGAPQPPGQPQPVAATPGGTASQSQSFSSNAAPNVPSAPAA